MVGGGRCGPGATAGILWGHLAHVVLALLRGFTTGCSCTVMIFLRGGGGFQDGGRGSPGNLARVVERYKNEVFFEILKREAVGEEGRRRGVGGRGGSTGRRWGGGGGGGGGGGERISCNYCSTVQRITAGLILQSSTSGAGAVDPRCNQVTLQWSPSHAHTLSTCRYIRPKRLVTGHHHMCVLSAPRLETPSLVKPRCGP